MRFVSRLKDPIYRVLFGLHQESIGFREVLISKPAASVGRKWTGMHGSENTMLLGVNTGPLSLGITTPQHENDTRPLAMVEGLNNSISKTLPTAVLMRVGLARNNSQDGVKQQDALVSPFFQTSALRPFEARNVILKLTIYVLQ